jgi:hypothetical protein
MDFIAKSGFHARLVHATPHRAHFPERGTVMIREMQCSIALNGFKSCRPPPLLRRNFTLIADAAQDSINVLTIAPDKFGEAAPGLR